MERAEVWQGEPVSNNWAGKVQVKAAIRTAHQFKRS